MAFVDSMHADAFQMAVEHVARRKARFDKKITEVTFKKGDLVQIYNNKLDNTFKSMAKLLRQWSTPMHIHERFNNSYTIETLEGLMLQGVTHARSLRRFIPRWDSDLAQLEKEGAASDDHLELEDRPRTKLANEITSDEDEAVESQETDNGSEDEGSLGGSDPEGEKSGALVTAGEQHVRMHVPWRGVPAPGSTGESRGAQPSRKRQERRS